MHCCVLLSLTSLSASMSSLNALFMTARGARRGAQDAPVRPGAADAGAPAALGVTGDVCELEWILSPPYRGRGR
jgi:hypothetical protein